MLAKTRQTFILILILSMFTVVISGCSDGASNNSTNANGGNKAEGSGNMAKNSGGSDNASDPYSVEASNEKIDEILSTIETPEYFKNTPTYEYTVQYPVSPEKDGESWGQKFFEKKFNVKLKFVRLDNTNRKEELNRMFATGTLPDFLSYIPSTSVGEYANQGLLAEVPVEMIKENMPNYYPYIEEAGLLQSTVVDGKNMAIPFYAAKGGVGYLPVIRADWLRNVGINKVPETLDELEEAFIHFRNDDPNQNGKKDTYALSNPSTWEGEFWFQSIFGAYGTNPFIWLERDGKLQFGFTTEETKAALKRLNKWYEMELISPEFITDNGRSTEVEDLATKFAEGKIGFMDNLSFEDSQWDNDGHINYRWVKNSPEWQQFFEENKDNPDEMYKTKIFTDFDDQVPQPIYINIPSITGPNGDKGNIRPGYQGSPMVFGKQMEEDPGKMEKMMRIIDYITSDELTYLYMSYGPDGFVWKSDEQGRRLMNPDWVNYDLYDPGYKKLGDWIMNMVQNTNPDFFSVVGGPRAEQRYQRTMDIAKEFPTYEDKLGIVLPSGAKYSEITTTRIKEYVVKAIAGDIDIDETFDAEVSRWYKDGGEQLTKEANDWYQ
jgi:putative aldouronate transport system substrate-binding protein